VSNVNCYVCNRGFPHIDVLYAHLGEHPGRTVEEMARAQEAWGRLKGTEYAWMLREAEHNDLHEVTTEIPGFAVNDAMAHESNRQKAVVVKATSGKRNLAAPHGADEDEIATVTPLTTVDASPLTREEWAAHDAHAEAQRKPYAEMASDFAARSTYKARQIPYAEAVGMERSAEYARREDAAEAEVEAERAAFLAELDRRDEVVEDMLDGKIDPDAPFDASLPDTPKTRKLFADHKARLVEARRAESRAMFVEQFPAEAKEQGVKAPKLTEGQKQKVAEQKRDAEEATTDARAESGKAPTTTPIIAQVNEAPAAPVKPPEKTPEETARGD
jgi:hypothetical protein